MRVSLDWLAEYCDADLGARELATRLAMTGTEVDRIHHHGVGNLDAFVVGLVLETTPHPDADRGAAGGVVLGQAPGVGDRCQGTLARAGPLDLGDDGDPRLAQGSGAPVT